MKILGSQEGFCHMELVLTLKAALEALCRHSLPHVFSPLLTLWSWMHFRAHLFTVCEFDHVTSWRRWLCYVLLCVVAVRSTMPTARSTMPMATVTTAVTTRSAIGTVWTVNSSSRRWRRACCILWCWWACRRFVRTSSPSCGRWACHCDSSFVHCVGRLQ